jgi:hypothetical protein
MAVSPTFLSYLDRETLWRIFDAAMLSSPSSQAGDRIDTFGRALIDELNGQLIRKQERRDARQDQKRQRHPEVALKDD